ncbi:hypothetical protein FJQ98_01145 [Lysinibacillus agricola]|uniref:Integrase n=1 Tax=Lysinibacillus agricola TaxID=2590012 RepID=A0ABX7AS11_9BACI|nr:MULTISPECIES: hypothetical protein [Lysinibacillus]KOS64503.1 hypothetical protein AN161_01435 [Lysinibacillus sp. FJAT-14222]QQP12751.1 hypothetical protein FJQ98_01145 [Lysinibacillus agricola]
MPSGAGTEEPNSSRRLTDSYFKLINDEWQPEIIGDKFLPFEVYKAGKKVNWSLTETHMYEYFKGTIFVNHSDDQRSKFLRYYKSCSYNAEKWIKTKLSEENQEYFEQFALPLPTYDSRDFGFTKAAREQARNTRKSETDAIVDFLPQIRAEGHFRWNQICRLRKRYLKACEEVKNNDLELPFNFEYNEPERIGERFFFRLWDRPSFLSHHEDQFSQRAIKIANSRTLTYSQLTDL